MSKDKKTNIHNKISKRSSQIEIRGIIKHHIIPMLRKNMTFGEICEELRGITNKSKSQCEKYIKRAVEELSKDFDRDLHTQRLEAITALRGDLQEAYTNYLTAEQDKDRVSWWKEYSSIKKRIGDLSPNELKADTTKEEDSTAVIVNYTVKNYKDE